MQYRRRFSGSSGRSVACGAVLGIVAGLGALSVSAEASAQAFPFPSSNAGGNGRFTTTVLTPHELRAQYNSWVQRFVQRCQQGDARVRYPESGDDTRSEGVGYGMVIAAYMGDQATFDGLWDYYQRASQGAIGGLMHWRRDGCGAGGGGGDTGSASDADIDAAFGLIVANRQWPGQYAADASRIVASIRTNLFLDQCAGVLTAGTQFKACGCINPSYIPPGYYPAFGAADQAGFWNTARTNSYTYFNAVNDNNTGLVPAWSQSNGSLQLGCNGTPQVSGGGNTNEFQADAARTPWRVATDFLWTGNAQASTFLQAIAGFANRQRITHIVDRYSLQGTPLNGNGTGANLDATGFRSTFTMGGFATAMIASSQADVDEFTGAWQSLYVPGDGVGPNGQPAPRAFNASLALLYGLLVTGYMWDPQGPNPTPRPVPTLNPGGQGNQIENGDFDEGLLNWTMENIGGVASEGFAMHLGGEMHLLNQRVAGVANTQWHVRFSQTVQVQANQRYRVSVRARADQERLVRLVVAQKNTPFATYLALDDDLMAPGFTFRVGTEMETYEIVGQSSLGDNDARFAFELADSTAGLVIDDVVFEPTTDPVKGLVDPPVVDPTNPTNPTDPTNPTNPTDPTTPGGNGGTGGSVTPVQNPGQMVPNQPTDNPGGQVPPTTTTPPSQSDGLPAPPSTRPGGNGTCTMVNDPSCNGFPCSVQLELCYDPNTGYVWDQSLNMGVGDWAQPPRGPCTQGLFWPKANTCYDPATGYYFDLMTMQWEYYGDWYTEGQDDASSDEGGCGIAASDESTDARWLGLLAPLALGLVARRRRRAAR